MPLQFEIIEGSHRLDHLLRLLMPPQNTGFKRPVEEHPEPLPGLTRASAVATC